MLLLLDQKETNIIICHLNIYIKSNRDCMGSPRMYKGVWTLCYLNVYFKHLRSEHTLTQLGALTILLFIASL